MLTHHLTKQIGTLKMKKERCQLDKTIIIMWFEIRIYHGKDTQWKIKYNWINTVFNCNYWIHLFLIIRV